MIWCSVHYGGTLSNFTLDLSLTTCLEEDRWIENYFFLNWNVVEEAATYMSLTGLDEQAPSYNFSD